MPRVFGMVTTSRSHAYTRHALESFFRRTKLGAGDELMLIDNDGDYAPTCRHDALKIVVNPAPRGFASNINSVLRIARERAADLVFLNNDIVFTSRWLEPLAAVDRAITIPLCNRTCQYRAPEGKLALVPTMDWSDFRGEYAALEQIVAYHRRRFPPDGLDEAILMPFHCFRLPPEIYGTVGEFDEGFGSGGAEDVDYRIRCLLAGFDVKWALASYLLHFQGKSTWRSGEPVQATRRRNDEYHDAFRRKWGDDLATIFLPGPDATRRIAERGLQEDCDRKDFRAIARKCLRAG